MQPCSREMQAMNSILNHHQQQQQSQMVNSLHQQDQQQQIQSHGFDPTSSHDDFLEQMLSSLPSGTWPPSDLSSSGQNPNNKSLPWESNLNMCPPSFDDQSVILASKLRHHQISGGGGGPTSPAAKALMLQQQLMLSRGLSGGLRSPTGDSGAGDSGLLPLPLSLSSSDDTIDGSSFKSLNPGGDGSVQALYNGFVGSLHASSQTSNQAQHFHHPQGGTMQAQNYGTPVGGMNQAPASGGSGGGAAGQPRQRVRARRGQATDPHSIAERLRRERIAERMKSLQELVPNANKTDKASMLDEIIDYVKFLQLQVKVLSLSRLGGAAAVAPVVADISSEGGGDCIQPNGTAAAARGAGGVGRTTNGTQTSASSSSNNNNDSMMVTEHQVAKLMEEDMGSAMQYLQGKGLCLMPISLATAISTAACHPSPRSHLNNNSLLPGGPTSPNLSVLSVQSATMGNVVADSSVKDAASVSKP